MHETEANQIRLIIDHGLNLAVREIDQRIQGILAANSAKGLLRSGVTIQQTVDAVATTTIKSALVLCESVKSVNSSPEAFAMLQAGVMNRLDELEGKCTKIVKTVSGRPGAPVSPSMLKVCGNLFDQFKSDLTTKLEIASYNFTESTTDKNTVAQPIETPAQTPVKNKGGKPLAAHWDEMWAYIAVQLYVGDLKPSSHKQIKDAMFGWFNAKSIDVGDTAVNDRARQLWQKIEAAQ